MARRGQCRCGSILNFEKGPDGYKTRCPSCGSVVRLKPVAARSPAKKRTVACPCGTAVPVRFGMCKATCPDCNREFILRKKETARPKSSARHVQAASGPEVLPRFGAAKRIDSTPASASDPPSRHQPASQLGPRTGRTVTCEVCHTIIPVEASQCSGCGSVLTLTTAAPALDLEHSSQRATVRMSLPTRLIFGWLTAGAALLVITAIVLILCLRH